MKYGGTTAWSIFMGVWIAYGLLGLPLLFGRNIGLKRRFLRLHIAGAGLLFLSGLIWTGFPADLIWVVSPVIALITVFNLWRIRFCGQCGATYTRSLSSELSVCTKCGASTPVSSKPRAP